jgi:Fe2+ or Zn2+ uptake regulation protein
MVPRVREVLPTVSHATVYRSLQELVREGLIRTLEVAGTAVQFEANPDDHHHFVLPWSGARFTCRRVTDAGASHDVF